MHHTNKLHDVSKQHVALKGLGYVRSMYKSSLYKTPRHEQVSQLSMQTDNSTSYKDKPLPPSHPAPIHNTYRANQLFHCLCSNDNIMPCQAIIEKLTGQIAQLSQQHTEQHTEQLT